MNLTKHGRNVHVLDIELDTTKRQEFWFLLSADHHWDNPDTNRDMMLRHLKEAKEKQAPVLMIGDFFCAMQGKYDRRSDKSKLRPEHAKGEYLDLLVNTAAEWLAPYREQIALIGLGNHETAILKNHETNLTERLVERLNFTGEHKVHAGGYGGYFIVQFRHKNKNASKAYKIKYFHGHGGGGPVTKGVIQSQRQAVYYPDADCVISGHVHEQYTICHMQERVSPSNYSIVQREQWHVRMPTYKDEYKDGHSGYHIESGRPPKPVGAYWLRLTTQIHENGMVLTPDFILAR